MRFNLQAVVVAVLVGIAIVYFAVPARVQGAEGCRSWTAEMLEDEGGPVLTAHACSDDPSESWLAFTCHDGTLRIDLDLAAGGSRDPAYDETVDVEFVTDGGVETISMQFQALTSFFSGEAPAKGRLVERLKSQKSLLIRAATADWPARSYSLEGSSAALAKLVAACG